MVSFFYQVLTARRLNNKKQEVDSPQCFAYFTFSHMPQYIYIFFRHTNPVIFIKEKVGRYKKNTFKCTYKCLYRYVYRSGLN